MRKVNTNEATVLSRVMNSNDLLALFSSVVRFPQLESTLLVSAALSVSTGSSETGSVSGRPSDNITVRSCSPTATNSGSQVSLAIITAAMGGTTRSAT